MFSHTYERDTLRIKHLTFLNISLMIYIHINTSNYIFWIQFWFVVKYFVLNYSKFNEIMKFSVRIGNISSICVYKISCIGIYCVRGFCVASFAFERSILSVWISHQRTSSKRNIKMCVLLFYEFCKAWSVFTKRFLIVKVFLWEIVVHVICLNCPTF